MNLTSYDILNKSHERHIRLLFDDKNCVIDFWIK